MKWPEARLVISLLLATAAFAISLIVLLVRPDTSEETVGVVVGAWLGISSLVANFWMGSSKGSADKGQAMRDAQMKKREDMEQ